MKRMLLVLATAAAIPGCGSYDNPFDTSDMQRRLTEEEDRLTELERELIKPWHGPTHPDAKDLDPNLDAWRAHVLEKSGPAELTAVERDSQARAAKLRERVQLLSTYTQSVYHYPLLLARHDLVVEEKKLRLIGEVRQGQRD